MTRRLLRNLLFREEPFSIVDVGASGGIESHWSIFRPDLVAFAFEPLVNECVRLNAMEAGSRVRYFDCFVGADENGRLFPGGARERAHVVLGDNPWERSSAARARRLAMLTPEVVYSDPSSSPVLTDKRTTLDRFFAERPDAAIDFIKIDTDGHDYEVILGAKSVLQSRSVLGLFVECQFHGPVHPHSNIFSNIDRELRELGFTLFDIEVHRYTRGCLPGRFAYSIPAQTLTGQVLWGDALYMRDAAASDYAAHWGVDLSPRKLLKLACLFELYGMPDCAAELLVVQRESLEPLVDVQWCLDALAAEVDPGTKGFEDTNRRFQASPSSFLPPEGELIGHRGAAGFSGKPLLVEGLAADREVAFVAASDAWRSSQLARRLPVMVRELDRDFPNWGVCGNSGLLPDAKTIVRAFRDGRKQGLHRTRGSRPVLAVGDAAALVDVSALRLQSVEWPISLTTGWGATLSAACLRAGLLPVVDDRLFTLHPTTEVPTPSLENAPDLLGCFDRALTKSRRRPSLLIACRTQLDRPGLLARAMRSFASEIDDSREMLETSVRLVTDIVGPGLEAECKRLRELFPGKDLSGAVLPVREKLLSRIDLLLGVLRAEETDFVWYVDDDDFLREGALLSVARMLRPGEPQLVVGHSRIFHEAWTTETAVGELVRSEPGPLFPAGRVLWALGGENPTPICSMVLPLHALRERTGDVEALGEYMEDYFLLMQLLTRGETIVDTIDAELAGISIREGGNTVTQSDRTIWHQSQAEFVGESLGRADDNNPLLWRLTEELLRVQSAATRLQEEREHVLQERQRMDELARAVLNSRSWRWSRPIRLVGNLLNRFKGR
jgi:FkbM family methyltransferase